MSKTEATPQFASAENSGKLRLQDKQLIRELVKEIATVADVITYAAIGHEPRKGSVAERQLASTLNAGFAEGATPVRQAHAALVYGNAAGAEQARAFVNGVNSNHHSFSLATLTRAAIEAFSKSYYLLSTDDPGELISRHLSLMISEMSVSSKHNHFMTQSGEPASPEDHISRSKDLLAELHLPLYSGPDLGSTKLFTTLLD